MLESEAQQIATNSGKELNELREAMEPLFSEMDNLGWRTSSFHC
jgi:hypothetical protein